MKPWAFSLILIPVIVACGILPSPNLTPTPETAAATEEPPGDPTTAPDAGRAPVHRTGTVTGTLSFPSSFIAPQRVVFFNLADGSATFVDTAMNQGTYSFDLPEGTYHVVAYAYSADAPPGPGVPILAGGYTQAVACGLSVECADHSLIPVTVTAGQTVTADPQDWYAPEGAFPTMPAP